MSQEKKASFEDDLNELEKLTEKIKNPETGIEEAVELYERAAKISKKLTSSLRELKRKIESVVSEDENELETESIDDIEDKSEEEIADVPF